MSTTPPPRRRRIAGESARPTPPRTSAKPVVKKPVRRAPQTDEPDSRSRSGPNRGIGAFSKRAASADVDPGPAEAAVKPVIRTASTPSIRPTSGASETVRLLGVLVALGVGLVVCFFGLSHWLADADQARADSTSQAGEAAVKAAEAIFDYDSDDLDAYKASIEPLMTRDYYDGVVDDLTAQTTVRTTATVREHAAIPCGDTCRVDQAKILMFLDLDRRVDDGDVSTFANRVVVDMVKVDGTWKVSDVTGL